MRLPAILKRIARWVAAIVLILVGLVLSIPGVPGPGFVVILLGIFVLLPESRWLRKQYVRFKRRYPRLFGPLERRRSQQRMRRREEC